MHCSDFAIHQTPAYSCRDLPVFAGMDDVRWEDTPPTGGCIRYDVQFSATKRSRARFGFVDAAAVVGGERICTARLFFSFFDK